MRKYLFLFLLGIFVSMLFISCATTAPIKNSRQSGVYVRRIDSLSDVSVRVFINGRDAFKNRGDTLSIGMTRSCRLGNGNHSIYVRLEYNRRRGSKISETIFFTLNNNQITFSVEVIRNESGEYSVVLSQENAPVGGTNNLRNVPGIEGALTRAAEEVSENFTARSQLAIVYITAQDRNTTEFITGELEHLLRRQGFIIIDRSELERIRREQNFQMSGEVDDATAVSIGKFAGANVIITGRIDGEGNLRRLRLRALDTTTAQVVGTASERL